jgi:hypothetical protein
VASRHLAVNIEVASRDALVVVPTFRAAGVVAHAHDMRDLGGRVVVAWVQNLGDDDWEKRQPVRLMTSCIVENGPHQRVNVR